VKHFVTRDDWIVGGLAALLLIDVLLFPWYSATNFANAHVFAVTTNRPAVQAPHAWPAILAALVLILLLVDLGLQRAMPQIEVSAIGNRRRTLRLVLAIVACAFLALKFLLHVGDLGWGFVLAVIAGVLLIYAALQVNRGASAIPGR
jgi:membrane-anchored protein YejM (alkaline phosphatase superfamily)